MPAQGLTILSGKDAPTMARRTTLRLGGQVRGEVTLTDPLAADALSDVAERLCGRLVTLGAGSNILAGDGPLFLVLVRNGMPPDITVLEDDGRTVVFRASSSAKLPVLLGRAARMDCAGLEGLTGIPGSVGGAVAMNAGSYGQCVADALQTLEVVTAAGEVRRFRRDEVEFGYRKMGIPGLAGRRDSWWMVLAAEFALTRVAAGSVTARACEIMEKKRSTQPVTVASAGCVFKNPAPDNPAGKLLDAAGFKGKRLGGMAFSDMHANFLVNDGSGTSAEALELMALAKHTVFTRYGINLETEVTLWV